MSDPILSRPIPPTGPARLRDGAGTVATVGVLGGGRDGRQLALVGLRLGVALRSLDVGPAAQPGSPAPPAAAGSVDEAAIALLAQGCDVVTVGTGAVRAGALHAVARAGVPVLPGERSLALARDRVAQERLLAALAIPGPGISGGAGAARGAGAAGGAASSLEQHVAAERELSVTLVRGADGDVVVYPLGENLYRDGALRLTRAPAPADAWLIAKAHACAVSIAESLDHVGALTLELVERDGQLIAAGITPTIHRTAHWTVEGAVTSQAENHLRAILGLPLGSSAPRGAAALVGLVGAAPPLAGLLAVDGVAVHLYGEEPEPGRAVGHVTLIDGDHDLHRLGQRLSRVLALVERSSNAVPRHPLGQEARHPDPR